MSSSPTASTTPPDRAAGMATTGVCAASSRRRAGTCGSSPYRSVAPAGRGGAVPAGVRGRRGGRRTRPARRPDRVRRRRRPGAGGGSTAAGGPGAHAARRRRRRGRHAPSTQARAVVTTSVWTRTGCSTVVGCPRAGARGPTRGGPGRASARHAHRRPPPVRRRGGAAQGTRPPAGRAGGIASLPWHCTVVGPLDFEPPFVERPPPPGRRRRPGRPDLLRRTTDR